MNSRPCYTNCIHDEANADSEPKLSLNLNFTLNLFPPLITALKHISVMNSSTGKCNCRRTSVPCNSELLNNQTPTTTRARLYEKI